jgi:hypothetical protein
MLFQPETIYSLDSIFQESSKAVNHSFQFFVIRMVQNFLIQVSHKMGRKTALRLMNVLGRFLWLEYMYIHILLP